MRMPPRRLTVLASIDVAGYTRLVEADERGTLAELATIRLKVMRPTLSTFNGNLFKTMGDGALIEFANVEDAVRWALEFQMAMRERYAKREKPVLVRCGVALADVYVQGEDRFGRAVGFVVRIQEAAPPGGISISHSVRWQLAKDLAAMFSRTESVLLKGNDDPIEISIWTPADAAAPAPEPAIRDLPKVAAPALASDVPSIAVLAFDNMSGDPSAATLADGIVEEITSSLSRIRDFTVIARNSAYAYKGLARDVRAVSRELGVCYLLEGSLRKAGERVRITAQLIDAATGTHIWADSYNGVLDNLFDFEDEIAERVAGALRPSIRAAEIACAKVLNGTAPSSGGGDRARPAQAAGEPRRLRSRPQGAAAPLGAPPRRQCRGDPPPRPGAQARPELRPGDGGRRLGAGAARRLQLDHRDRRPARRRRPHDRGCRRHGR